MKNRIIAALLFALALFAITPALAQFADQQTWGSASGGTANAQTVTIANVTNYNQLLGVKISYVPSINNIAGSMTLAVSGLSALSVRRPTNSGSGLSATMLGNEFQSGQPITLIYDGSGLDIVSGQYVNIGSAYLANSALGFDAAVNLAIYPSVSANNLTIQLCQAGSVLPTCSAPSASSPILIPFRNGTTIAYGNPIVASLQSAQSFTIASESTMGCLSGVMCRIWVLEFYNGGTPALCAYNSVSGTSIGPINEGVLQTSQSGTSGGNTPQDYYCNVASVTNSPMRILGYFDIQETTAGTWATGPTLAQLFGPGVHRPGEVVQEVTSTTTTQTSIVNSAAKTALSLTGSITPTSAANLIHVTASGGANSTSTGTTIALFRGTGTTQIGSTSAGDAGSSSSGFSVYCEALDAPNSTSSVQYGLYSQNNTGTGNFVWLPAFSFTATGLMRIQEIMSMAEPANDDELRKAA